MVTQKSHLAFMGGYEEEGRRRRLGSGPASGFRHLKPVREQG